MSTNINGTMRRMLRNSRFETMGPLSMSSKMIPIRMNLQTVVVVQIVAMPAVTAA